MHASDSLRKCNKSAVAKVEVGLQFDWLSLKSPVFP
jgi:hypothetical protein